MKVIIAEKPSVAREIASVLGVSNKKNGYFENDQYAVTWAFGHLIQLSGPEAYGYGAWAKENLPIIPGEFKLQPKQIKSDKVYVDDPGAAAQLNIISGLFKRSEGIIVATDAGREGELIFRLIYAFLGINKPYERLWISSLTEKAIKEGFKSLKKGSDFDCLYESALCRAQSDWLVGINATQALTLSIGNKSLVSVGRVQTPTLALICQRFMEYSNFKAIPFHLVRIELEKSGVTFFAGAYRDGKLHHFETLAAAEQIVNQTKGKIAVVTEVIEDNTKEPPPLLYDLSTLQQDANKRAGLTADQTLTAAQQLYESKLITYPRTGSRYIGEDVFETVPQLIAMQSEQGPYAKQAEILIGKELCKRSVNGDKVTDHHALLPTEQKPGQLGGHQEIVYNLVAGRMLEAFSEYCLKIVTTAFLKIDGCEFQFVTKGVVIIQPGWRSILNIQEDGDKEQQIPGLKSLDPLPVLNSVAIAQKTKPKPLYTEGTLLKAMETCGKEIQDEELRSAMKECGLGTPATRAATIETLFARQYIDRQKKSLIPTTKGLAVFELVKEHNISQPVLTGEWEKKLEDIRTGELLSEDFLQSIREYTEDLTKELMEAGSGANAGSFTSGASKFSCPKCKKGTIIMREKAAGCSNYKEGCDFAIWRTIAGKKISDTNISNLLQKGKTPVIKGFTGKNNNEFDAGLKIDEDFKITFYFKDNQNVSGGFNKTPAN